jgi:invasion protein IalB
MQLRWYSTVALVLLASTASAVAQTPSRIGVYKDWAAYSYSDSRGKVCYAASQPKDTQPKGVKRDAIFFMISTRPAEKVRNEVSVLVGYPLKQDSKVSVAIGEKTFAMFTKEDGAWVENISDESVLVDALKAGANMIVKGTSRRGTNTTDTYSLSGISAALDSVAQACQ